MKNCSAIILPYQKVNEKDLHGRKCRFGINFLFESAAVFVFLKRMKMQQQNLLIRLHSSVRIKNAVSLNSLESGGASLYFV